MSQDGAQTQDQDLSKLPIVDRITINGIHYEVGKFLGGGIEGRTFMGKVVAPLPANADPRLQVGTEVALKQQPISGDAALIQEKREGLDRETAILAKEGSFFGSQNVTVNNKEFMIMAIPIIKGQTLRDRLYDIDDEDKYVGKKVLSAQEKASLSYQILRDYAAQQQLSLLHVDIKPDNVLVGDDGKVKVVDWGNSWDRDESEAHPKDFQSPGALYAAPENYHDVMDKKDRECTPKADEYAIGMMLASIWSASCYEKDADLNAIPGNDALSARQTLNDILGPNAQKPADMPEDLFKIIRNLTAIKPEDRPENIALADGMRESTNPMMQDIVKAQARLDVVVQDISATLRDDFRKMVEQNSKDPKAAVKQFDTQVQQGSNAPNPLTQFKQVHEYLDKLRALEREYAATNPRRTNQLNRLQEANNQILADMINSGDPYLKKIAEKAFNMAAEPSAKLTQALADYNKVAPDMLKDAYKSQTIEGEIYNRLEAILKSSKDPATIRIGISDLYAQLITLAAADQKHNKQYNALASKLDGMLRKLDESRTAEARQLQGNAPSTPQLQNQPKASPQQSQSQQNAPQRVRKPGYIKRAKIFLRSILEPDPVKIATQLASQMSKGEQPQHSSTATQTGTQVPQQTSASATTASAQTTSNTVGTLQTLLSAEKTDRPDTNPLSLGPPSHVMQFSRIGSSALRSRAPTGVSPIPQIDTDLIIRTFQQSGVSSMPASTAHSIVDIAQKVATKELTEDQSRKELVSVTQKNSSTKQKMGS